MMNDVDIRPMIQSLTLRESGNHQVVIDLETRLINGKGARIRELILLLGLDPATTRILKRATHLSEDAETAKAVAIA